MKRKLGLLIIFIFVVSSLSVAFAFQSNSIVDTSSDLDVFDTYLTIDDLSWTVGTADRNSTHLTGFTAGTGYTYDITDISTVGAGVLTQSAMDGVDGSWAVLLGPDALTATTLKMLVDEDQISDTERAHATEQVNYLIFE